MEGSPAVTPPVAGESETCRQEFERINKCERAAVGGQVRQEGPERAKKVGERSRMGLEIQAVKEIDELKSEIDIGNPAGAEHSNEGDSIGISLLDLAEILDQHKIWWNQVETRASRRISAASIWRKPT
jgi:hypothetical protein